MMKLNNKTIAIFASLMLLLASCGLDEHEAYDLKFIHIMKDEVSSTNVSQKAKMIGTYNVYMSAPASVDTVRVTYEIEVGDGLKQDVDYKLLNQGNTLTFLPGIYDMPIRIQWLPNPLDPAKENSITIRLLSNDKGYTLGLPGPDKRQVEFVITKI